MDLFMNPGFVADVTCDDTRYVEIGAAKGISAIVLGEYEVYDMNRVIVAALVRREEEEFAFHTCALNACANSARIESCYIS